MENFENHGNIENTENTENTENIAQESEAPEATVEPAPVQPSPFADSPYIMEEPESPVQEEISDPQPKLEKKKRTGKILRTCIAAILVIALVVGSCGATAFVLSRYFQQQNLQFSRVIRSLQNQIADLEQKVEDNSFTGNGNSISGTPVPADGLTPGQIHAQNKNSVVGIANQGVTTNIFGQVTETASSGSGFIISSDGYIVTNYHVIEGAKTLTVITNNEAEYPATVVGYDKSNDFAVIKIDVTGLTPVKIGSSDDLIVGDQVVAIGNPLGEMTNSLTVGYISVKNRNVTFDNTIINMLQTDTAINPGNSGGPLFNMKGEVIGITSGKYAGQAVESIGFAIPIDDVAHMIKDLLENGYISAPYMGVTITAQANGIGAYVYSVEINSPAARAGLRPGDIIVGIGEYEVTSLSTFDKALRNFKPKDTATIQVYRNRQILDLPLTFGSKYQPAT